MPYMIYGKHTKPWRNSLGQTKDADIKFRALDYGGYPVTRLANAGIYATREDAQEVIDKCADENDDGLQFLIKKVK